MLHIGEVWAVNSDRIDRNINIIQSLAEFEEWKSTVEESEQTSFILHRGKTKRKDGSEVSYYQCNRTGKYRSSRHSAERRRKMKSQGNFQ